MTVSLFLPPNLFDHQAEDKPHVRPCVLNVDSAGVNVQSGNHDTCLLSSSGWSKVEETTRHQLVKRDRSVCGTQTWQKHWPVDQKHGWTSGACRKWIGASSYAPSLSFHLNSRGILFIMHIFHRRIFDENPPDRDYLWSEWAFSLRSPLGSLIPFKGNK